MASAGTAYVDVEARTDTVADAIQSVLDSVDWTIEVSAEADVSAAESELDKLEASPVEVPVDADTIPAQGEIDSLEGGEPVVKEVKADTDDAQKSIDDLSGSIGALGDVAGVGGAGGALAGLTDEIGSLAGASAGVAAGLGVAVGAFAVAIDAAGEAEVVVAQTDSILASLGDSAVVTGDHIAKLSEEVMRYSGFSDEAVRAGANTLLMFDNIASAEVFDRAIEGAADLAVRMGSDVPAAARLLGMALQDPEAGMSRLRRAGITLTDAQKEQVASFMAVGDVASAQEVILASLEGRIGNLAEDYGDTMKGGMDRAKEAMGELAETAGGSLLPIMSALSESVVDQTDRLQSWDDALNGALLSGPIQAIAGIGDGLDGVGTVIGELPPGLRDTASAADQAAAEMQDLAGAMSDYLSQQFDVPEATRQAGEAFTEMITKFTDGESTWADQAAAQQEYVTGVAGVITAMSEQGASQQAVDDALRSNIGSLRAARDAGEITGEQFVTLRDQILGIPHGTETRVLTPGAREAQENMRILKAGIELVPIKKSVPVSAPGAREATADAWGFKNVLDGIPKSVTSYVNVVTTGSAKISARGGPLARGELSLVGEEGPEMFVPNTGGNIIPAMQTAQLMMGAGSGGGPTIHVHINGTATQADGQAVVDALRRWQQRNGPVPVKVSA